MLGKKPSDKKEKAEKILDKAVTKRREQQYQFMLNWKNGEMTGLECIEKIEALSNIIEITQEDFREKIKPPEKK